MTGRDSYIEQAERRTLRNGYGVVTEQGVQRSRSNHEQTEYGKEKSGVIGTVIRRDQTEVVQKFS
jgi:hypothetical protein